MHKWKKVLNFVMAVTLLAASAPVSTVIDNASVLSIQAEAYASNEDGFMYNDYGSYVGIVGYEGEENGGVLVIPSEINGLPVTRIEKNAFADTGDYGYLTSITIPETIEYIGANAFAGCKNVTEGYIPSKFVGICAAATTIEVSENVTQLVKFEVIDNHKTKVSTKDGLASLYTEYKIDGTSLADRGLAVPQAVAQADVEGLTAASFENFVNKYSTIDEIIIYSKTCELSDGLIPESAGVAAYVNSTGHKYAISASKTFRPLDELTPEQIKNEVSVSMAYSDYDTTKKFIFNVTADTSDYYVYKTGIVVDKNNVVNENTTDELVITDERFVVGTAKNKNTAKITVSENGYGLWVKPYVVVDNGSGKESEAVTVYGEAEFVYSADHVLNNVGLDMQSKEVTASGEQKLQCAINVTNDKYTLVNTGVIADQNAVVADASSAKALLTLTSNFAGKVTTGKQQTSYKVNIADKYDKGVWVVGYTTVSINGHEVTKYTEPISWSKKVDPFENASVEVASSALTATKFQMNATAKADGLKLIETGILTNKTGSVTEENAAELLRLNSDLTAKQQFTSTSKECAVAMTDIGNGIWYVGYMTVEAENGERKTIYSTPEYVYSEAQVDGVSMNMSVSKVKGETSKFRFDVISRTGDETAVQSGVIVNRVGAVTKETAKELLTLDSSLNSNVVTIKTNAPVTSYSANVKDTDGKGIWCVGYLITDKGTYYTEPVYIHDETDVALANLAINMVSAPVEGNANKYRFDVTSITGDIVPDKTGVIVSRDGTLTEETAAEALVLNSSHANLTTTIKTPADGNTNTYAANVKFQGKGIWIAGYVVVTINGDEVVKYTQPVFVPQP